MEYIKAGYNMEQELKEFIEFKNNYNFKQLEITEDKEGNLYCKNILLKDNKEYIGESEAWINVGYNFHGTYPKLLSNLFPYKFTFKGFTLNSIESFFQVIKFKDKDIQKQVFTYSGKEACIIKETSDYNWQETGIIYWQGTPIKRDSKDYDLLVTELYISAIQNYFYRNIIKKCSLPIIHAIGKNNKNETVFTRYEFEFMVNCLHDFLNRKER